MKPPASLIPEPRRDRDAVMSSNATAPPYVDRSPQPGCARGKRGDFVNIPGYRITSEIHRGGQGIVYKAIRESTGQTVAVKVLRWPSLARPEERSRFEREVEVLGSLRHPNIVRLNDGGALDDCCYFVMDFVDGEPLPEWVS